MMLQNLADARRELAGHDVLSVYIAADEHDPTERRSWRMRLTAQLDAVGGSIDGGAQEAFAAARAHLDTELESYKGFLPGRGWAAFVTAEGVWHIGELPAPMPDLVRWRHGPVLGPYLRALKQNRPVEIALVDQRRARLLRYRAGELNEYADFVADRFIDDLTDRNTSKRAGAYSGMRGETATDAADRILKQEAERLLKQVAKELRNADADAFIVLGGSTSSEAALQKLLPPALEERTIVEPALHLTMTTAELLPLIEAAASALSERMQLSRAQAVLDDAGPGGSGTTGREAITAACERGQVERLLVSPAFLSRDEEAAESLIAQTLDHGGTVELVGDGAAELLDGAGDGACARLRYAVKEVPAATV